MIPPNGQPITVFVAMPCDDGHKLCFWQSVLALAVAERRNGVTWRLWPCPGDSLIPRKRNELLWLWYTQTTDDYLCFLDSDLEFVEESMHSMASRRLPIICGLYGKKQDDLGWVMNALRSEPPFAIDGGVHKIACGGTGAIMIHRSVVAKMIEPESMRWWWEEKRMWRIAFKNDNDGKTEQWHLFSHVVIDDPEEFPHSPRDMSEDWSFCYYARKLGFDVWMDTWARFLHEGSAKYPKQARRLTQEEIETGMITQPDGSKTSIEGEALSETV